MLEIMRERRSVRKYKDKPVNQQMVKEIMAAAVLAPSSKNRRPLEYVVVQNRELLDQLINCKPAGSAALRTAPLAIVVLGNKDKSDVWIEDGSIAMTYMMLKAQELGLGSCWIQMRLREGRHVSSDEAARSLLNIPDDFEVLAVLAIGYPDEDKKPCHETEMDQSVIHAELFNSK